MSGTVVGIVGPSGAGKDSLLRYAKERMGERMELVRRVITRGADSDSEDHDTLDEGAFERAEQAGAFALSWSAHGLRYGLPASLDTSLAQGRVVVANLSRRAVPGLVRRYPTAVVVLVTADRSVIAQRLVQRGRESAEAIRARLERAESADPLPASTVTIDNSGPLAIAGEQLVTLLRDLAELDHSTPPVPSSRLENG